MVGAALNAPARAAKEPGPVALKVSGLSLKSLNPFGTALKGVTFEVRRGEVLGIGGVAGNGQDELLLALSGEIRSGRDAVQIDGLGFGDKGPTERRRAGLVTAPEERLGHAACPDMSLTENALLSGAVRKGLTKRGFIDWTATRDWAEQIVKTFDVRTPGVATAARALSGGNLQKFVIGREILQSPSVIVVNQPTWGVDASAAAFIRQALLDRASDGAAIVVISQDIDELMEIADRFAALNEGRLSDSVPTEGLTIDRIGLMLGGAHGMHQADVHHAAEVRHAEA
jgi:simple sugar transport system ATP-binding protein